MLTAQGAVIATHFNPRPREEGDHRFATAGETAVISIHALVKRATICSDCYADLNNISIHALVKRATYIKTIILCLIRISIHALVKRATCAFV